MAEDKIFKQFKEHSVAEFFKKNRQMLGFSGKVRSFTIVVHELVTNGLDACEEAGILPEITVKVEELGKDHYKLTVTDNGPGIPKTHVGKALGQMLAGTKFHRYIQQRGQQGIGACMSGDTLIPLYDGRVLPIKKIVEKNMVGESINTIDPNNLHLHEGKITKCWKIKNPKFIKINTQRGREIKLTPENPVLTIKNGEVTWIRADKLTEGMRIAAPRKLLVSPKEKIRTVDLLDLSNIQVDEPNLMREIETKLMEKYGSLRKASKQLKIDNDVLRNWFRRKMENGKQRGRPTIANLLKIAKDLNIKKNEVLSRISRIGRKGTYMNIPEFIDEECAWLAGLMIGDGNLTAEKADKWGVGISLSGNDEVIINKFTSLLTKKFGLKARVYYDDKKHYYLVHSSSALLASILGKFGVDRGNKSKTFDVPDFVFSLNNKLLAAYLKGLFDAEGSVSIDKHTISFHIYNKKATEKIFYALLRLGIYASINKAGEQNRITITEKENIKRFIGKIGFTCDKKSRRTWEIADVVGHNSVTEVIPEISELSKHYVYSTNNPLNVLPAAPYSAMMNSKNMSRYSLKQLIQKCGVKNDLGEFLSALTENDIIWLKVHKIKEEKNEDYVYDLEVENHHNFVANGLITHNSGCTMFSYVTTGQPTKAISYYRGRKMEMEIGIDFKKNRPIIRDVSEESTDKHGIEIVSEYKEVKHERSSKGIFEYLRRTALANPHGTFTLTEPDGEVIGFPRSVEQIPKKPYEIKPHPLGVSAHDLLEFARHNREYRKVSVFLQNVFSRVSSNKVSELKELAPDINFNMKVDDMTWDHAEKIVNAMKQVKWIAPPMDALVPIGKEQIEASFNNIFNPEIMVVTERKARVYRGGIPFMVEAAVAYGGGIRTAGKKGDMMRFANRVPLLFDTSGCAITTTLKSIEWKRYNLKDFEDEPVVVLVNLISVHVPYTSAGKQAISDEEDVVDEIRFAVMEAARGIQRYLSGKRKANEIATKRKLVLRYIQQLSSDLSTLSGKDVEKIQNKLQKIIDEKYVTIKEEKQQKLAEATEDMEEGSEEEGG